MRDGWRCEELAVRRRRNSLRLFVLIFEWVFPVDGQGIAATSLLYFDAGREGEAGDGEADHLPLTATEATDGIAHEQYFGEVFRPHTGTAKALARAVLAADGDAVARIDSKVRGAAMRGVRAMPAAVACVVIVFEVHL